MRLVELILKFTLDLAMLFIKGMASLLGALLTLIFNGLSAWMARRAVRNAPKSPLAQFHGARGNPQKYRKGRRRRGR